MKLLGYLLLCLGLGTTVFAETIASPGVKYDSESDVFQKGQWEGTVGAVAFFSPYFATKGRPTHDYALAVFDVGYMLSDVKECGFARGNFEVLGELFGGPVYVGRGNYVAGMTLWGRYNFVQPDWKV